MKQLKTKKDIMEFVNDLSEKFFDARHIDHDTIFGDYGISIKRYKNDIFPDEEMGDISFVKIKYHRIKIKAVAIDESGFPVKYLSIAKL